MAQYWFKPKCCGWGIGWPIAWQGWVSVSILMLLIIFLAFAFGLMDRWPMPPPVTKVVSFVVAVTVFAMIFCLLLGKKVEGGLKWRWKGKE